MNEIQFLSRVWKAGNSFAVTIPVTYIEIGLVKPGEKYFVKIKPVELDEEKKCLLNPKQNPESEEKFAKE